MDGCSVCKRIEAIKSGTNQSFVKELPNSYVVIGDYQYYRGYTVLISKVHATELHELTKTQRNDFLEEMADTAAAVFKAFKPTKLNYELLGNTDSHMHWHIFPRYQNDPAPLRPVWVNPKEIRNADSTIPSHTQLADLKAALLHEL